MLSFIAISLALLWNKSILDIFCVLQEGSVKKHKLAKELSDLVNYFVSVKFQDFQLSIQNRKFICCL